MAGVGHVSAMGRLPGRWRGLPARPAIDPLGEFQMQTKPIAFGLPMQLPPSAMWP